VLVDQQLCITDILHRGVQQVHHRGILVTLLDAHRADQILCGVVSPSAAPIAQQYQHVVEGDIRALNVAHAVTAIVDHRALVTLVVADGSEVVAIDNVVTDADVARAHRDLKELHQGAICKHPLVISAGKGDALLIVGHCANLEESLKEDLEERLGKLGERLGR
jgi:hypothetical protein